MPVIDQYDRSNMAKIEFETTERMRTDFLKIIDRLGLEKDGVLESLVSEWIGKRRNVLDTKQETITECAGRLKNVS